MMARKYTAEDRPRLMWRLKQSRDWIRMIEALPESERTPQEDKWLPEYQAHEALLRARIAECRR